MSAIGWSGRQLGKRWVCKELSWLWRICQRLVCSSQLTCFGLFSSQSELFEYFLSCFDWLDKSQPSEKATIVLVM